MPGLYAEADVSLEHRDDIPSVPLQAINHEGDKTTVFVVNRNGEIEDRPITLGIQTATDAEIVSGLNEGEQVMVSDRSGAQTWAEGSSAGCRRSCDTGKGSKNEGRGSAGEVVKGERQCRVFPSAIRISSS